MLGVVDNFRLKFFKLFEGEKYVHVLEFFMMVSFLGKSF